MFLVLANLQTCKYIFLWKAKLKFKRININSNELSSCKGDEFINDPAALCLRWCFSYVGINLYPSHRSCKSKIAIVFYIKSWSIEAFISVYYIKYGANWRFLYILKWMNIVESLLIMISDLKDCMLSFNILNRIHINLFWVISFFDASSSLWYSKVVNQTWKLQF